MSHDSSQNKNADSQPDVGEFLYLLGIGVLPILLIILIAAIFGTTNQNPM